MVEQMTKNCHELFQSVLTRNLPDLVSFCCTFVFSQIASDLVSTKRLDQLACAHPSLALKSSGSSSCWLVLGGVRWMRAGSDPPEITCSDLCDVSAAGFIIVRVEAQV